MREELGDLQAFAAGGPRRGRRRTSCCWAWAARRWRPRSSAARSASRAAGRACTCSTPPTRAPMRRVRGRASTSTTRSSSSRRSRAGRSRRCRCSSTSGRCGPTGRAFVAITDPGSGLEKLASEHGFRRTFLNDPDIGGRYSALSFFGLVPAALMGADVRRAAATRAGVAEQNCQSFESGDVSSGLWLGLALGRAGAAGRDKLTYVIDPPLQSFGLWVEQLIAESTGKHGKGIVPVVDEPLGDAGRLRRGPHLPAPAPRRRSPTRRPTPRSRRCARPATR